MAITCTGGLAGEAAARMTRGGFMRIKSSFSRDQMANGAGGSGDSKACICVMQVSECQKRPLGISPQGLLLLADTSGVSSPGGGLQKRIVEDVREDCAVLVVVAGRIYRPAPALENSHALHEPLANAQGRFLHPRCSRHWADCSRSFGWFTAW